MSNMKMGTAILLKEDNTDLWVEPTNLYRCAVYLVPEEDGGFSATAPELPGAASQGESESQALSNITEAVEGLIQAYKADGVQIPWKTSDLPKPEESTVVRWVFVNG